MTGGSGADELVAFLSGCEALTEEGIIWGPRLRFLCRAFATEWAPPRELVTSARCIVIRSRDVLSLGREGDRHIMPGGQCQPEEWPEATARREVLEETGWELGALQPLGCIVFTNIDPRPPDHPYPYPHFTQVIYAAETVVFQPEALCPNEIDGDARFLPVASVQELPLPCYQRAFLERALVGRHQGEK